MKIKAALFDLDGVVIDSETLYTAFWNEINEVYPVDIPNFAIAIKGRTLQEILDVYPTQEIRDDITSRLMRFQDEMVFNPLPGVVDFLNHLHAAGVPAALVTSSDSRKIDKMRLKAPELLQLFDIVIDGSMVSRSKPDPQGYLMAAQKLSADIAGCVVFEDSINGLKAGRASGATVVGLATTCSKEQIEPFSDYIIERWSEIYKTELFLLKS